MLRAISWAPWLRALVTVLRGGAGSVEPSDIYGSPHAAAALSTRATQDQQSGEDPEFGVRASGVEADRGEGSCGILSPPTGRPMGGVQGSDPSPSLPVEVILLVGFRVPVKPVSRANSDARALGNPSPGSGGPAASSLSPAEGGKTVSTHWDVEEVSTTEGACRNEKKHSRGNLEALGSKVVTRSSTQGPVRLKLTWTTI